MITINDFDLESKMLLELNKFIHSENKMFGYHMKHIQLVRKYAFLLNKKLDAHVPSRKLSYIALSHDLFKERSLDQSKDDKISWRGHNIPQDTNRYVRTHLDVLEEYGLDEFFNSDIQYHALASGIFLRTEFGITDKEILYPVFFHSCPIISVYEKLSPRLRKIIDITMLSDKLSSNYLRINYKKCEVRIDLDQAVFGSSGKEFNYTLGLFLARLIGQGKSDEKQSNISTEYFYKRLCDSNPIISKNYNIKKLGGNDIWPERRSQVWRTH